MATTIHVGNLSFKLVEEDLTNYFSKYGKVTDTYVVRRNGRPRGYGFVEFDSSVAADNALAANGTSLDGRNLNIEKAKGKIQKSNFSDRNDGPPRRRFNDRDNRDSYRDTYRDNNYRDNNYRENNYRERDNTYRERDNTYRERDNSYRERDNTYRSPRRFLDGPPRRYFNNNDGSPNRFGSRRGSGSG